MTANVDCNIPNFMGKSPLHFVVDSSNTRIANLLAATLSPFNFDVKNDADDDPFVYALNHENSRMVCYFLAIGYNPFLLTYCNGESPMHLAMQSRDFSILRSITRKYVVDNKNHNGHSPLAVAIINSNETAVDILWRRKADWSLRCRQLWKHIVASGLQREIRWGIVAHILQYTTDVNAHNKEAETALHIACLVGYSMTIVNLSTAVPDVTAQDDDLRNALTIAM
jgi:ankyrin repeat protein